MSDIVLKTEDLGISFGGLRAVQGLNLEIKKKQLYGLVGPNGAGKTTVFNMLTGVYQPTTGRFFLEGEELTGKSQESINHKGIARTFQNIRLFNNMSVIRNVLVGLHSRPEYKCNPFVSMFRLPKHFEMEKKIDEIIASSKTSLILDYALLCGLKHFEVCDIKILLKADLDTRYSRVKERENITKEYFISRDNSLSDFEEKHFDYVFHHITESETNSLIEDLKSKI